MTRITRWALSVLLVALAGATLAACGSDSGSSDEAATKAAAASKSLTDADLAGVTLRVGTQKDGIRAVLQQSGQLDGIPYQVDFSVFQFGPPLVEAAGADKIDLAWVGSTPPIFGAAAGSDFKIIAGVQEHDNQENSILVQQDAPYQSLKDLAGKKIAVAKGSSAHGLILNALKREGMEPDDVQLVYLAPADGLAAYAAGSVDAWVVWDPFSTQALQEGSRSLGGGEPDEAGTGFEIASAKALEDPAKRAAIDDYVNRLARAWKWAEENPDEWAKAWATDTGLPLSVTQEAVKAKFSSIVPIDAEIEDRSQKLADLMTEDKVLPGQVTFKDIVDPTVVQLAG